MIILPISVIEVRNNGIPSKVRQKTPDCECVSFKTTKIQLLFFGSLVVLKIILFNG